MSADLRTVRVAGRARPGVRLSSDFAAWELAPMPVKLMMLGVSHSHSHSNARAAAMVPEVELVGIYDADRELAARRRNEWAELQPNLAVFETAEEGLERQDIQGVIVDGRVQENLGLARMALEHGKHVLLEKPAGTDFCELLRLDQLAQERGLLWQVGYIMRYNAGFLLARRLVEAGALGHVFAVRGRISWDYTSYEQQMPTVGVMPGGMLFELGCHCLDLITILLGAPTSSHAHLGCHGDPGGRYIDHAVAVLEYERAFATIETCALESGALQNRAFEVYGTRGTVVIQPLEPPEVVLHLEEAWEGYEAGWQTARITPTPRHVGDLQEFAACIRGEKAPTYPAEHDLLVQQTLLSLCVGAGS